MSRCADEDVQVELLEYWCAKEQKNKNKYGVEVGSWLAGLFTDGLSTAAAIGKML